MATSKAVWRGFASDNYAGVHPEIWAAMGAQNEGHATAYGDDTTTARLQEVMKAHFGDGASVFPVFNGTGANVISLQACCRRWEAVIAPDTAHIVCDEGGAPEKMAGLKIHTVSAPGGKLTPALIESLVYDVGSVHRCQPAAVSLTQTTELGTVYSVSEVRAISKCCRALGLLLHMDGARLSNAAAALGVPFRDFTTDAGVDILSFGGTKIGCMGAEAVVVLTEKGNLHSAVPFIRKTSMQLASKMRFMSAQLIALLEGDLYLRLATHANAMARLLEAGVRDVPGVLVPNPAQANAVFPVLPMPVITALQKRFKFYVWSEAACSVRWMCSWDTSADDVAKIVDALKTEMAQFHAC